jgi:hypothetical protein
VSRILHSRHNLTRDLNDAPWRGQTTLTNGAEVEFDGITNWRLAASDHGAI